MPPDEQTTGHDIVVVGASAGGVEALRAIAAQLPADLPAGGQMVLMADDPRVTRVIEITGLGQVFRIEASLPEAVRKLVEGPDA